MPPQGDPTLCGSTWAQCPRGKLRDWCGLPILVEGSQYHEQSTQQVGFNSSIAMQYLLCCCCCQRCKLGPMESSAKAVACCCLCVHWPSATTPTGAQHLRGQPWKETSRFSTLKSLVADAMLMKHMQTKEVLISKPACGRAC